jgi:hypothetical protein
MHVLRRPVEAAVKSRRKYYPNFTSAFPLIPDMVKKGGGSTEMYPNGTKPARIRPDKLQENILKSGIIKP